MLSIFDIEPIEPSSDIILEHYPHIYHYLANAESIYQKMSDFITKLLEQDIISVSINPIRNSIINEVYDTHALLRNTGVVGNDSRLIITHNHEETLQLFDAYDAYIDPMIIIMLRNESQQHIQNPNYMDIDNMTTQTFLTKYQQLFGTHIPEMLESIRRTIRYKIDNDINHLLDDPHEIELSQSTWDTASIDTRYTFKELHLKSRLARLYPTINPLVIAEVLFEVSEYGIL